MKLGVVARADNRGIGYMTHEFVQATSPARVLVVREPGAERQGFAPHLDRYPHADVVWFDPERGQLPEQPVRDFLAGLDVVYLVETAYDPRLFEWARAAGARTVLHAMPEFWRWDDPQLPRPDVWWLPTRWRADLLPAECRVVPVPCPAAPQWAPSWSIEPTRFVHVAGHRAAADRNGTLSLYQAFRHVKVPLTMRIEFQDAAAPIVRAGANSVVELDVRLGGRADRFDLYRDADVLVLPRRYGGLSLPVLEAFACGLAVLMTDVEPQRSEWPIVPVAVDRGRFVRTAAGRLALADAKPAAFAATLDSLSKHRDLVEGAQQRARQWAADHSWPALLTTILRELDRAIV